MTYPIVLYGEPVLEKNAETVTEFDTPEMHKLIDDMFESMYTAKGVGLAAPQIGIAKRIAVIDLSVGEDPKQTWRVQVTSMYYVTSNKHRLERDLFSLPDSSGTLHQHTQGA